MVFEHPAAGHALGFPAQSLSCRSIRMPNAKFSIPVFSHRHVETPFDKKPGFKNYLAIVEVSDLPDLTEWRRINVRDPKLSGSLTREMRESFLGNKEAFVF